MDEVPAYPHIPYGEADFRRMRLNRWLYVDKTRFVRLLEQELKRYLTEERLARQIPGAVHGLGGGDPRLGAGIFRSSRVAAG